MILPAVRICQDSHTSSLACTCTSSHILLDPPLVRPLLCLPSPCDPPSCALFPYMETNPQVVVPCLAFCLYHWHYREEKPACFPLEEANNGSGTAFTEQHLLNPGQHKAVALRHHAEVHAQIEELCCHGKHPDLSLCCWHLRKTWSPLILVTFFWIFS